MALQGFSAPLWPVRYRPLPDELLSSWLVRLAHGHAVKVQTFCHVLFGQRRQVWNRDIDRLGPAWILDVLQQQTFTPPKDAMGTTLRVFEGILFPVTKESGNLTWVAPLQIYHRVRQGTGMQFCPACLAKGPVAYFRKTWRLAIKTMCVEHRCMLHDRCPACGVAVSFFRMDMGRPELPDFEAMALCWKCGFDLAHAPRRPIPPSDPEARIWLDNLVIQLDAASERRPHAIAEGHISVLRQLMHLLLSARAHVHARRHLLARLDMDDPVGELTGRLAIESLPTDVRHSLLVLGSWVMCRPRGRLTELWRAEALRYNHFLREFSDPPAWYLDIVTAFRADGRFVRKPARFHKC